MSGPEYVSELVDITDLPMDALDDLPDTVLASVLQDVRCPSGESFAAFTSALL
ncbi:FxSxx-COOH cyclophane-containing RiPP peptide [Streptomyces canus]|uniref:FxSxx-COOH cyclophane-containing RiPP peptide n=1 Tax=Streptomyces canus TaxID=58343 RepID=UPI0030E3C187